MKIWYSKLLMKCHIVNWWTWLTYTSCFMQWTADLDEEILVVVTQMDHLGIEYNNIAFVLEYFLGGTCKVGFILIKEYLWNPFSLAAAISYIYTARFTSVEQGGNGYIPVGMVWQCSVHTLMVAWQPKGGSYWGDCALVHLGTMSKVDENLHQIV